jgi:hypothetical protein
MTVTYEDAKKVARSIARTTDPVSVILFGSLAGKGIGNDLDLLVVRGAGLRAPATMRNRLSRKL